MVIAKSCSLFTDIIATALSENMFVNTSRVGANSLLRSRQKRYKIAKNGQKMEFLGKWWQNGIIIALSNFLIVDIIATAPGDNIFDNESGWE